MSAEPYDAIQRVIDLERERDELLRERRDLRAELAEAKARTSNDVTREQYEIIQQQHARLVGVEEYAERMQRERDDAEMLLRMMVSRHRRHPFIPEKWVEAATRFGARNASPLRQGSDSPCAAVSAAPSTDASDPSSQAGPSDLPSDVQRGVAQSEPRHPSASPLTEREQPNGILCEKCSRHATHFESDLSGVHYFCDYHAIRDDALTERRSEEKP